MIRYQAREVELMRSLSSKVATDCSGLFQDSPGDLIFWWTSMYQVTVDESGDERS